MNTVRRGVMDIFSSDSSMVDEYAISDGRGKVSEQVQIPMVDEYLRPHNNTANSE